MQDSYNKDIHWNLWYHLTSSSIIVPQTFTSFTLRNHSPKQPTQVFFWVKRQGTLLLYLLEVSYFELPELWALARLSNFRTPWKVHTVNGSGFLGAGHTDSRAWPKEEMWKLWKLQGNMLGKHVFWWWGCFGSALKKSRSYITPVDPVELRVHVPIHF